jgi:hypothetical protein
MSEYQYYEFQAIDRPLTPQEQQAVARLSSRVDPHPRRAIFVYNWRDFPGSAENVLAQYYDAMLYITNWGSRQLMFRFPRSLIDLEAAQAYCQPLIVEDFITFSTQGEHVILNIEFNDDKGGGEWVEGEGWLDAMLPLRDDILRGDYRALYLAWLQAVEMEDVLESVSEPPLPPGLRELSPALQSFVDFFEIDKMLLQAAGEASGEQSAAFDEDWMRQAISKLPRQECDALLLRLAQGEAHLGLALKKRLRELAGASRDVRVALEPRRTVGQIWAEVEQRRAREHQKRVEATERKRIERLEDLARRESQIWAEVEALIQRSQAKPYDQATRLLGDLKELAAYQGREGDFATRMDELAGRYSRRSALLERFRKAKLI